MKKKRKKATGIKLLIIFLIAIIGVTIFFIKQDSIMDFIGSIGSKETIEEASSLKTINSIEVKEDIEQIDLYGDDLIFLSNKKLKRMKIDGSIQWEKDFNFTEPLMSFGEERIYITDKSIGEIYILNLNGESLDKIELNQEVINLVEDSNNLLVHIQDNDSQEEYVKILSKDGEEVIDYSSEDGNILTYSLAKDKKSYAITSLDLSEDKLKSRLETYKINSEELYNNNFNDEIILYSNFIEKDTLVIMTDNTLYVLKEENIVWEKDLQLVKDIYINNDKINILYSNMLEVLTFEGKTDWKYSFSKEYNKITPFNKNPIIYGEEYITILEDGNELFEYKADEGIFKVISNKDYLFIIYKNKIDILSL